MPYQIKKLLPRHMKILNLYIQCKQQKDIAREVGLTPQAVSYIVNSPVFQKEYAMRRLMLDREVTHSYLEQRHKEREIHLHKCKHL